MALWDGTGADLGVPGHWDTLTLSLGSSLRLVLPEGLPGSCREGRARGGVSLGYPTPGCSLSMNPGFSCLGIQG